MFLLFVLLFNSCQILSFCEYQVNCNSVAEDGWFCKTEVEFEFSDEVEQSLAEKNVSVFKNKNNCEAVFYWEENSLFVKPAEDFIKGNEYEVNIDGTFYLKNGGSFTGYKYLAFKYGVAEEEFKLLSCSSDEEEVSQDYELFFEFNQSINKALFTKNFSLTPYTEFELNSNEEGTRFTVKPKDKWKINENYRYSIDSLTSNDGWVLNKVVRGGFKTQRSFDNVELLSFNPVLCNSSDSSTWTWFKEDEFSNVLCGKMGIGLIFNQEMDFNSIKTAFSVSPDIAGTLVQLKAQKNKFVYVTDDFYKLKTPYTASVSKEAKNLLGQYLFEKKRVNFESTYDYLKIEKIIINQTEVTNFSSLLKVDSQESEDEVKVFITVKFSESIAKEKLYEATNKIRFSLLFPSSSSAPVSLSTEWNNEGDEVLLVYEKVTRASAEVNTTYRLKINGGTSGVKTEKGKYLEDSLCVNIQVL